MVSHILLVYPRLIPKILSIDLILLVDADLALSIMLIDDLLILFHYGAFQLLWLTRPKQTLGCLDGIAGEP